MTAGVSVASGILAVGVDVGDGVRVAVGSGAGVVVGDGVGVGSGPTTSRLPSPITINPAQ